MSSSASALVMSGGIWEFMFGVQCCSRPTCRFSWSQVWIDSAFVYPLVDGAFVYSFRSADGCGACSCRHSACDVWCSAVPSSGIAVTAVAVPTCPCCARLHICASTARGWPLLQSLFLAACDAARVRSRISNEAALWRLFLVAVSMSVLASRYLPVCPAYPVAPLPV